MLMSPDNLPRVHGGKSRPSTSVQTASARDAQLTQSKPNSLERLFPKGSEETKLCSRKMRGLSRTRLLPTLVLICCVYLVYRFFSGSFRVSYTNKLGAALPELTVFGNKGLIDRPEVNIVNELAIKRKGVVQGVFEEQNENAAQHLREDSGDSLGTVACIPFKATSEKAKICLHSLNEEDSVSRALLNTGYWDKETVEDFKMALDTDSGLGVIDIGANLGVYSLLAAYMGRHVLAVDACHHTLLHLKKSIEINSYTDRVSILEAAIMETRGYARLTIPEGDYGSAFPTLVSEDSFTQAEVDTHKVIKAIKLEDVIEYVRVPRVILKIDIDGEEYGILQKAKRLFEVRDVKYIFMVFSPEKGTQLGKKLGARFLQEQGYVAKRSIYDKELFFGFNGDDRPTHLIWEKQYKRKTQ